MENNSVLKRQATLQAADNLEELKELQKQIAEYRSTIESTLSTDNECKFRTNKLSKFFTFLF